jgi:DNA-binding NarL/FixJ family response regulator
MPPLVDDSRAPEPGIRVLCVDDHEVLVEGLRAQFAIEGRARVARWLPSAARLLEEVRRLRPDIVLLDIEMPGPDVFETADRLRRAFPDLRFAFLSAHIRDGYLAAAYRCGAWGYFAKSDEPADIVAGIYQLAHGTARTFVMGPKVRDYCGQRITPPGLGRPLGDTGPKTPMDALTSREIEILRLIGQGMSRVDIAHELSRSAKTVDGHQERMMRKLGIASRADLMRFAIREGLAEA